MAPQISSERCQMRRCAMGRLYGVESLDELRDKLAAAAEKKRLKAEEKANKRKVSGKGKQD